MSLSTKGQLQLTFIGTGSAFAKTLNQNNLLVSKGEEHLLIDCGNKCPQSLHEMNLPLHNIRNFLITHSHADHVGGLEEAQLYGRYVKQQKPRMIINRHYEKILWEQSLRGGSERSEGRNLGFRDLWDTLRPVKLSSMPRETWHYCLGDLDIKMPRTKHFPDSAKTWRDSAWSCAVILDERVLFTSDTRFDPDLLMAFDAEYNFETIFHDCQQFTGGVHASLFELATLPAHIKSRIILMHYGDNWRDFITYARDAGFAGWAKQGHSYTFE